MTPMTTASANVRPSVRGVIEGFYNRAWTPAERGHVVEFIAARRFNVYALAPKTDPLGNEAWRVPYPEMRRRDLESFTDRCRAVGLDPWIGVRPVAISYADAADADLLVEKLRACLELGAERVVVLADDIPGELDGTGAHRFGSLADAHVWLVHHVIDRLALDPRRVVFVPTEYHGLGSPYKAAVGERLNAGVDVCWTGPRVCSPTITADDVARVAADLRRPPLVWDNYPVNDAVMLGELHLGPIRAREAGAVRGVRGFLVNPALEPEATLIPLATWGELLEDPDRYDADAAWERALRAVAGDSAPEVATLVRALDRSVIRQGWQRPRAADVAEAVAALARLENRRLAADLDPYIAGLPLSAPS